MRNMSEYMRTHSQAIIATFVLVVFVGIAGFATWISYDVWGLQTGRGLVDRIVIIGLIAFAGSIFSLGALRYSKEHSLLDQGEIRSSIAIAMTVMYLTLLPLSLLQSGTQLGFSGDLVKNFGTVYIAVIGFYFGSTALEKFSKPKDQT
jgi:hypothetical protein